MREKKYTIKVRNDLGQDIIFEEKGYSVLGVMIQLTGRYGALDPFRHVKGTILNLNISEQGHGEG